MKTLRQWRKLWDAYYNKTESYDFGEDFEDNHPQTFAFISARKLFRIYVADYDNYATYEIPGWVNFLIRFIQGNGNRHHANEIKGISLYQGHGADEYLFPKSTTDNYDETLKQENTPYTTKQTTIGTIATKTKIHREKFRLTEEEWKSITEQRKTGNYTKQENVWRNPQGEEENFSITREGKSYLIKNSVKIDPKHWYFDIDAIFYRYQVYDLLNAIQEKFSDTPINPNGDLAKILKVIEEKTGHSISVKYADYGIDHFWAMGKGFMDTFKPYKYSDSDYYFYRVLKQPLYGFSNMVRGLVSMFSVPFIFLRNLLALCFFSRSHDNSWSGLLEDLADNAQLMLTEPLSYFFDGFCLLTRGFLQMITTPFSYFSLLFRKPESGDTIENKIKNNSNIQNLLENLKDSPEENKARALLVSTIHRKYLKGVERGEKTSLQNEHTLFMKANFPQNVLINNNAPIQETEEDYLQQFERASI